MQLGVLPVSFDGSECDTSAPSELFEQETVSSATAISSDDGMSKEPSERPSPSVDSRPLSPSPQQDLTTEVLVHAVEEKLSMNTPYDFRSEVAEEDDYDIEEDEEELEEEITPYPHIFVIGDAADAFGAIKAGHTASFQAEVAAANILRLIEFNEKVDVDEEEEQEERAQLQHYVPGPPQIKVSLGLVSACAHAEWLRRR